MPNTTVLSGENSDLPRVIAGELEGSWRAGGQQEGLQYNGEAAG